MLPKQKLGCYLTGLQTFVRNGYIMRIMSPTSTQIYTTGNLRCFFICKLLFSHQNQDCLNYNISWCPPSMLKDIKWLC